MYWHNPLQMEKIGIVLAILIVYQFCIRVDAQYTYVNDGCTGDNFNYTSGSVYEKNLNRLFENLTSKTTSLKFYNYTTGVGSNQVYGLFQCRNDVSFDICSACVENATQRIVQVCPLYGEAVVWYYECMLRYANRDIFSKEEILPNAYFNPPNNVSNFDTFAPKLASAMNGVIENASSTSLRFASAEPNFTLFQQIYSFAQCTPDIDPSRCNNCLKKALNNMIQCCNASTYAMVFFPSCELRYDTTGPFIDTQPSPVFNQASQTSSKKSSIKPGIIAAIVVSVSAGLIVLSAVLHLCLFRKKTNQASNGEPSTSSRGLRDGSGSKDLTTHESLQYDMTILRIATNNFSNENKLGEGGFGSVYKGTFANGEDVAVKRLSRNSSSQGAQEFKNEILLVAKLQHRNLATLLGFCLNKEEKLLVYEYMPNKSLDNFVFDPVKQGQLNWGMRYNIIQGIAKGMLYLHEDSGRRIIHRDLKASNILLDANMNPKIADFGLARMFGYDKSQSNTIKVAGTYGYMAPEYVKHGQYSMKSDVYSFGVLVLEIISGKKISAISESGYSIDLVLYAWKSWQEGKYLAFVDPSIRDSCLSHGAMRCLHLGLLCVQEAVNVRPTMVRVVMALDSYSVTLPAPRQPGFFNNTVGESDIVIAHSSNEVSLSEMEPR